MAINSPSVPVNLWEQVRVAFLSGSYVSLKDLAERFGVSYQALRHRVRNEKWNKAQIALLHKAEQKIEKTREIQVEEYLKRSFSNATKYEKLIEVSMERLAEKDLEGNPIIDPDSLDTYSKVQARMHEMAKSSLRIAPVAQAIEHTGKLNMNIEHSLVSAIAKLREGGSMGDKLPSNLADRLIDIEVIDPSK